MLCVDGSWREDPRGFCSRLSGFDTVVFDLDPRVVEVVEIGRALEALHDIPPGRRPSNVWITFNGFDNDSREVFEIPECVKFCSSLVKRYVQYFDVLSDDRCVPEFMRLGFGRAKIIATAGFNDGIVKDNDTRVYDMKLSPEGLAILDSLSGVSAGQS
jgi:hypothetical protein